MKSSGSRERPVLICVDDDAQLLETLEFLLAKHFSNYKVIACVNGRDALEQLELCTKAGREVQLVLSDQVMDDLSGIEVLSKVPEYYPEAVRIILTGQAGLQSAIDAIKLGINDYLEKPVTEIELVRTLRNHLANYILRLENRKLQEFVRVSHLRASEVTVLAFRTFNHHLTRLLTHDGERKEVAEAIRRARENIQLLAQLHRLNHSVLRGQTMSRFNVQNLLEESLEFLTNRQGHNVLEEKGQHVQMLGGGLVREVEGHRAIMRVVLERVLENAWKFSPPGATLVITAHSPEMDPNEMNALHAPLPDLLKAGQLVISISDEATPSSEDYENLRYAQQWQAATGTHPSALRGLGLVIAQEYLFLVGGQQYIEAAPGQTGVTVHVALPVQG